MLGRITEKTLFAASEDIICRKLGRRVFQSVECSGNPTIYIFSNKAIHFRTALKGMLEQYVYKVNE